MKKKIYRAVEFDALNMRTARDIRCRGPVLNLGDAPQLWDVRATVIVRGEDGDTHHAFQFRPSERVPLAALNRLVADYDRGAVVAIPVKAVIR